MAKLSDKDLFHYPGKPNKGPAYLGDGNLAKDKYKRPDKLLENPDAIVIGSGIGGLGIASILAQRKGWKVLLLEGNKVPGGCTHCHELGGYEFNSGIDSIGDMDPRVNRGLFRPSIDYITDYQLDWAKMPDVHEISEVEGDRYEWHSSPQKNIDWVEKQFPGEGNVRKYYKLESAVEWWAWAWTVTKLLPTWIPLFFRELFYKVFGGKWRKYMQRTSKQVFQEELGFSDKLMAVYSYMYGNYGRPPSFSNFAFHAVNLLHYKEGAYYPVGGPGQIAECVVPILEKAGGQLAVDCRVKEIVVEGNTAVGVELDDGQTIRAPLVISDASAHTTFLDLLPDAVSKRHGYPDLFTQIRPSVAHLYIFLGYDEAIDLPPQIFWDLPRYDLEEADKKYKGKMEFDGMGSYLLSPSARDPVYAERYPDKSTVIVLAECPWDWVERLRADPEFKAEFEENLETNLMPVVHKYMPQLKDKTPEYIRSGAPVGCNPWAWEGCSLGLEPSADRFIKHTHWLRPKTKVKNLFLTGQDALSMGFAGSMLASRVCYASMTGNWCSLLKKRMD